MAQIWLKKTRQSSKGVALQHSIFLGDISAKIVAVQVAAVTLTVAGVNQPYNTRHCQRGVTTSANHQQITEHRAQSTEHRALSNGPRGRQRRVLCRHWITGLQPHHLSTVL